MTKPVISYADISDILTRRTAARKALIGRSFVEKINTVEALRERLEPFRTMRAREQVRKISSAESKSN